MSNFMKKLTSRKFLMAVVGVVSGLALAFGVKGSEITDIVTAVGGSLTAVGRAIAYINAGAKVDAAAAGKDTDHGNG